MARTRWAIVALVASLGSACTGGHATFDAEHHRAGQSGLTASHAPLDGAVAHGPIGWRLDQLPVAAARPELVVQAGWGVEPGRFGRDVEASRPGPMSLAVDLAGRIHVLDQVNRRVQVFDGQGQRLRSMGQELDVVDETAEDLVVTADRLWVLSQPRPGQPEQRMRLVELSAEGRLLQAAALHPDLKLVTGLFARGNADAPDLWVELRHREQVRVVREGRILAPAEQVESRQNRRVGRPNRWRPADRARLIAARTAPRRATVAVVEPDGLLRPALDLACEQPLVHLLELARSARGDLYLALAVYASGSDGGAFRKVMVIRPARLSAHLPAPRPLRIELVSQPMATDAFRPLTVGPDGAIYQLHTTEQGVSIWRWRPGAAAEPAGQDRGGAG